MAVLEERGVGGGERSRPVNGECPLRAMESPTGMRRKQSRWGVCLLEEQNACEKRRKGVFHGCVVWGWMGEVLGRGGSPDNSAKLDAWATRALSVRFLPALRYLYLLDNDDLLPCNACPHAASN